MHFFGSDHFANNPRARTQTLKRFADVVSGEPRAALVALADRRISASGDRKVDEPRSSSGRRPRVSRHGDLAMLVAQSPPTHSPLIALCPQD
ncbi:MULTISPECIES: hypothetical protein [unclassified Neorhizobium]|uniref:hypothetical protein n=1 Tax=unclassified Neorhizobium TaxID=2629175 RepID=UPI001FF54F75|nr:MULTISPECIES: hypothetical protein [unclassified Neorhizobium]MCJ9670063.1 hypothetical protein [Neorhizobium sp. SHOUNA12B]MCJ9746048.1 hypothetical protein [Neorhizobium sp. SHOUNA12A]